MFARLRTFPPQIWLLFAGTLLSSTGQALVWPFLTIFIREQLDIPLSRITLLFTLQSIAGFAATTVVSPLMDRFGRKWLMVVGLVASSAVLLAMSQAGTYAQWAVLLPLYGVVNAIFRIGSYAMVADLVSAERRAAMYALLRMGDNLGISVGPAMGGFLAAVAYELSYFLAAGMQIALAVFTSAMIAETLPREDAGAAITAFPAGGGGLGYGPLLRDRSFLVIWGLYILIQIANSMVFVLLGVYVKENYAIPEDRYGLIIGTNALMVVVFQYAVTRASNRRAPLNAITVGGMFQAVGLGVFAISRGFGAFLGGMVVFTVGELLLVPTATALVANIAPPQMRARYMGVFSLSFRVGSGIGPVVGGLLNDHIAPAATWYGAMAFCAVAVAGFGMLARRGVEPGQPVAERGAGSPL